MYRTPYICVWEERIYIRLLEYASHFMWTPHEVENWLSHFTVENTDLRGEVVLGHGDSQVSEKIDTWTQAFQAPDLVLFLSTMLYKEYYKPKDTVSVPKELRVLHRKISKYGF